MPSSLPKIIDVSIERAYEIAEGLKNKTTHDSGSTKVFSGVHEDYGAIHVSIPPAGDATLLPVVIQDFAL